MCISLNKKRTEKLNKNTILGDSCIIEVSSETTMAQFENY